MSDKKSFILYYDHWELIKELSMQQRGELFTAIFEYEINKAEPDFNGELKMLFTVIRQQLDRNAASYKERCAKNRENARIRWEKEESHRNDKSGNILPF